MVSSRIMHHEQKTLMLVAAWSWTQTWPSVVTWVETLLWPQVVGQAIPLYPYSSSFLSLDNAQTVPFLFLYHLSTTYLHTVVVLPVCGPCDWCASG